ncbi:hypothetical protein [Acinetobacter bereziniae]|uniref:hypothetical protein n=1 Tax=Acinetobacter bereziniae TaxID=106648 RepID=UPI003009EBD4
MSQKESREIFEKNKDSLDYKERYVELKRIVLDTLSLYEGALNGHNKIFIDLKWSNETKELIKEIKDIISNKMIEPSNYALLSLIDNKLVETTVLLDQYFKIYTELDLIIKNRMNDNKSIDKIQENKLSDKLNEFEINLQSIGTILKSFSTLKDNYDKVVHGFIDNAAVQTEAELNSFRKLRNIADNAKTENIYDKAVERYRKLEVDYRTMFYLSIGITLLFSILVFSLKKQLVPIFFTNIEFWAIKLSLLAVGVTLITYFLKQSTHYQRLADQNYQTQIELQAYPSFMESIPTDEAASVRKELALKYFGREIDGSVHKDMGNLIVDQMKSTTEMVKATTDAIKKFKEY